LISVFPLILPLTYDCLYIGCWQVAGWQSGMGGSYGFF
jgi:hypothetical protein